MYDLSPGDDQRERVLRAAAACPVQAILVDRLKPWDVPQKAGPRRAAGHDGETLRWVRRIVIVGASLAGLQAAEALRAEGFTGSLTLIGDEPKEPYDRPPLSSRSRAAWWERSAPRCPRAVSWTWSGGSANLPPGSNQAEAALDGVFVVHTSDDARRLRERLAAGPRRVLVIGAGFTGSEVASVCRELGLPVTVVEHGPAPLVGALGGVVGRVAADIQRDHGVDLRCGVAVTTLEGDGNGRLRRATCRTATPSTSTSRWPRWAPSATWSGWRARDWRQVPGGSPVTRAAAPSR